MVECGGGKGMKIMLLKGDVEEKGRNEETGRLRARGFEMVTIEISPL